MAQGGMIPGSATEQPQKLSEGSLIHISKESITAIKDGDFVVIKYPKNANMEGIKRMMQSLEVHLKHLELKIPVIFLSDDFTVHVLRKEDAEEQGVDG